MEPKGGFEPPTCRLQIGCAANCATWAYLDPKPIRRLSQFFALDENNYLPILRMRLFIIPNPNERLRRESREPHDHRRRRGGARRRYLRPGHSPAGCRTTRRTLRLPLPPARRAHLRRPRPRSRRRSLLHRHRRRGRGRRRLHRARRPVDPARRHARTFHRRRRLPAARGHLIRRVR